MKNLKRGTPLCGIVCGGALVLLAALIMWIGFWRTLLLAVLFAAGYFLGAVEDKPQFVKQTVGKVVPEKKERTIDFKAEVQKEQQVAYAAAQKEMEAQGTSKNEQ